MSSGYCKNLVENFENFLGEKNLFVSSGWGEVARG